MEKISVFRRSIEAIPFVLEAVALHCGDDWTVAICGGEKHHVGASAVAYVLPSLKDSERLTATVSVMTVPGHKEDELARNAALSLAKSLNTTVAVSVGIHIDNATGEDIQNLVTLFNELVEKLELDIREQMGFTNDQPVY